MKEEKIDIAWAITRHYKVACGWVFLVNFIEEMENDFIIHGLIFDSNGFKFEMSWDSNGYPVKMNEYPTYYYMRLIKK